MSLLTITPTQSRRLLLDAQKLSGPPKGRPGPAMLDRLITDLGFVQVDSIAAVERAHHLTLRARMPGYTQSHLTVLTEERRTLFEHWTHDASVIPVAWRHHWKHRFDRYAVKDREHSWWSSQMGDNADAAIRHVLTRITREGPLKSRDFQHESTRGSGWWNWKPAKAALEYLWRSGRLAVAGRDGFQKVYDLAKRVHPNTPRKSSASAHVDWACSAALDRLGTATPTELAAFFRAVTLSEAREWTRAAIQSGRAIPATTESDGDHKPIDCVACADIEERLRRIEDAPLLGRNTLRLLCPFDPVVRDRKRLLQRFGFDYRFEAFVPAAKRRYGYYVQPILEGEHFIGRIDLRTDRDAGTLHVNGLWWESGIRPHRARTQRLQAELRSLAAFVGVDSVS